MMVAPVHFYGREKMPARFGQRRDSKKMRKYSDLHSGIMELVSDHS
jgi:hypothetical protein